VDALIQTRLISGEFDNTQIVIVAALVFLTIVITVLKQVACSTPPRGTETGGRGDTVRGIRGSLIVSSATSTFAAVQGGFGFVAALQVNHIINDMDAGGALNWRNALVIFIIMILMTCMGIGRVGGGFVWGDGRNIDIHHTVTGSASSTMLALQGSIVYVLAVQTNALLKGVVNGEGASVSRIWSLAAMLLISVAISAAHSVNAPQVKVDEDNN
jgi:hypothetical protein